MSKKNIKLLIIIIVILAISTLAVYFITKKIAENPKNNAPVQMMTDDERRSLNLYRLGVYEVVRCTI